MPIKEDKGFLSRNRGKRMAIKPLDTVAVVRAHSDVRVRPQSPHTKKSSQESTETAAKVPEQSRYTEKNRGGEVQSASKGKSSLQNRTIQFEVQSESHEVIIKVVDRETGQIVRQVPPANPFDLAKRMEQMYGRMLLGKK
jgi:flagellar protein FlaG